MKTFVYSLFLSLCFFSCDEPDTKGKEIINYYPYVDTYPVDHVNPIAETKKLPYLPGYPIHYNAGAVSYQNKLLLAVRIETFDRGLLNGKNSRVILTFADKEFRGYQGDQKIVLKHNGEEVDIEDPRLFSFKGEIWMAYNTTLSGVASGIRQMYLAKLDLTNGLPSNIEPKRIAYDKVETEKNWTPFEYEGELYFISHLSKQNVFKVNPETGEAIEQSSQETVLWPYGQLRGGSPALVLNDNEYITFFHSSKHYILASGDQKNIYFAGALTFSRKPPFEILRMTKKPIMDSSYYNTENSKLIIFPTGILLEDDKISMLSGKNDDHLILSEMSLARLEQYLEPIS